MAADRATESTAQRAPRSRPPRKPAPSEARAVTLGLRYDLDSHPDRLGRVGAAHPGLAGERLSEPQAGAPRPCPEPDHRHFADHTCLRAAVRASPAGALGPASQRGPTAT